MAAKTAPSLDDLLDGTYAPRRRVAGPILDAATRTKRQAELTRRQNSARYLAFKALAALHADDYDALFEQAKAKVSAESGPLPGDT